MLLAELGGKAPWATGSEDVLTSSVFGSLDIEPTSRVLSLWLARARTTQGECLKLSTSARLLDITYWPRFRPDRQTEPDVALTLEEPDGSITLAFIEVKYRSGISSAADEQSEHVTGQLGRQWRVLDRLHPSEAPGRPSRIDRRVLVYLTNDLPAPDAQMRTMLSEIEAKTGADQPTQSWYWLSWRSLAPIVGREMRGRAGDRLIELLRRRALTPFEGLQPPLAEHAVNWIYASRQVEDEEDAFRTPALRSVHWNYNPRTKETHYFATPPRLAVPWRFK